MRLIPLFTAAVIYGIALAAPHHWLMADQAEGFSAPVSESSGGLIVIVETNPEVCQKMVDSWRGSKLESKTPVDSEKVRCVIRVEIKEEKVMGPDKPVHPKTINRPINITDPIVR